MACGVAASVAETRCEEARKEHEALLSVHRARSVALHRQLEQAKAALAASMDVSLEVAAEGRLSRASEASNLGRRAAVDGSWLSTWTSAFSLSSCVSSSSSAPARGGCCTSFISPPAGRSSCRDPCLLPSLESGEERTAVERQEDVEEQVPSPWTPGSEPPFSLTMEPNDEVINAFSRSCWKGPSCCQKLDTDRSGSEGSADHGESEGVKSEVSWSTGSLHSAAPPPEDDEDDQRWGSDAADMPRRGSGTSKRDASIRASGATSSPRCSESVGVSSTKVRRVSFTLPNRANSRSNTAGTESRSRAGSTISTMSGEEEVGRQRSWRSRWKVTAIASVASKMSKGMHSGNSAVSEDGSSSLEVMPRQDRVGHLGVVPGQALSVRSADSAFLSTTVRSNSDHLSTAYSVATCTNSRQLGPMAQLTGIGKPQTDTGIGDVVLQLSTDTPPRTLGRRESRAESLGASFARMAMPAFKRISRVLGGDRLSTVPEVDFDNPRGDAPGVGLHEIHRTNRRKPTGTDSVSTRMSKMITESSLDKHEFYHCGGGTVEFRILLHKTPDSSLGIDVDPSDGRSLRIDEVREDGLFDQWNSRFPNLAVRLGDRVVEVNGSRGQSLELFEQCKIDGDLHIVMEREVTIRHPPTDDSEESRSSGPTATGRWSGFGSAAANVTAAVASLVPQVRRSRGKGPLETEEGEAEENGLPPEQRPARACPEVVV